MKRIESKEEKQAEKAVKGLQTMIRNLDVDLRWDSRRPDEEAYRRRCLIFAIGIVKRQHKMKLKQ